jgi:outer membrane protein TolC
VERLRLVLKSTKAFHEVHMAPYVQVLQAGVDLADAEQLLSQAENDLKTQIIQLNILVGLPPGQTVTYQGSLENIPLDFPMTEEQCLDHAYANRPDLIAARKNLAIAEKGVAIEAGRFYPTINLEGHYTTQDRDYDESAIDALGNEFDRDQQNDYWTMGVNLRWTLFESGKNYYGHHKAKQEVSRQEELVRALEDQIHSEVRTQFANMTEAKGRIGVTRKFVSAAQENFDLASKRFELQLGTTQEVLDAQERLTTAETERNGALFDYQQALANLCFAIGLRNDALSKVSQPVTNATEVMGKP